MAPQNSRDWVDEKATSYNGIDKEGSIDEKGKQNIRDSMKRLSVTPGPVLSPEEVHDKARALAEKVLSQWNILRSIVGLHSDTLEKLWNKKNKEKQKELLLKAWPDMSANHRPDYDAYRQENSEEGQCRLSKFQDAYKWPQINQEVLSSSSLLVFINSRARNPPSSFVRADIDAGRLGSSMERIPKEAALGCHTLFLDGDNVETYGRLVPWDKDIDVANQWKTDRQLSPGIGLRALELQDKIYTFLVRCCQLILPDLVNLGTLSTGNVPTSIILEPIDVAKPVPSEVPEILPSLAAISSEAPYRLPANPNFELLRDILSARLAAQENYLSDLREDPGFFAHTVNDWSEHHFGRLLGINGEHHPAGPHTSCFWENVIEELIDDAHISYEKWYMLHSLVSLVCTLKETNKNKISSHEQLPEDYLLAIIRFSVALETSIEGHIDIIQNMRSSPSVRDYFIFYRTSVSEWPILAPGQEETKLPFAKCLDLLRILKNKSFPVGHGIPNIIDAFEQLSKDPKENKYISSYISNRLFDLSIYARAINEVDNYQSWAATFKYELKKHRPTIKKLQTADAVFARRLGHGLGLMRDISHLGTPHDGKFEYPINQKCTKRTTEQMIAAENNLDAFWKRYDARWKHKTGRDIRLCFGDHPPKIRWKIQRTMPWVERIRRPKILPEINPYTPPQWIHDEENEKLETVSKKLKAKTRGTSEPEFEAENNEESPQLKEQRKVKLERHLLRVFKVLFYQTDQNDIPGSIPWNNFLQAMVAVGFSVQQLYGNVWQFTPISNEGILTGREKAIQFHSPHPEKRVEFIIARRMGKRLNRNFGWEGWMFEEE
ncbi:hypothetical protein NHQ30_008976 [Ciborinia camelliae]|nr:hypothetical protein NHQ30_008976 [Ciborinia camelliae]